ncbi:MAG: AAA family ATPase [Candidatus Methylomirabilis sp.]|nr:AAA family ATPase [Deltaproteobacteria bacterium]
MDGPARLIEGLLRPEAFPERPSEIELRQTHVSYLLFTPDFVYKIKKPVDFGFLDFTTLEKRRFFCEEEVRLNRRLAPDAYLGVSAISEEDGAFFMGGPGNAIEYAVKMKRLDNGKCLSTLIASDRATQETAAQVARAVASFHAGAGTDARISGFGSIESIRRNTGENFSQTLPFIGRTVSQRLHDLIRDHTEGFLSFEAPLLESRTRNGFIRDCHGDIHSEHVFIDNGVQIIDCIEFNERFRYSDVIADAAFLSMDLDFLNRHALSSAFDEAYFHETGDYEGSRLMDFYRCYRAFVRGKVEGFKASEPEVGEAEREASFLRAACHFHLSGLYASGGFKPMLIIISGLSGTGKSSLAAQIALHTNFVHLSSDAVRKELAGLSPYERRTEPFGQGIYSEDFTERTYKALISRASDLLGEGRSVILDATFGKRKRLLKAREMAARKRVIVNTVECTARNSTIRERLRGRLAEPGKAVSDADWDIYLRQKALFEQISGPHIVSWAEDPLPERVRMVFSSIFG